VTALTGILERSSAAVAEADLKRLANLPKPKQREVFQPFYYKGEEAAPDCETRVVSVNASRLRELARQELQRRHATRHQSTALQD
jgi:hypothetical protein